MATTQKYPPDTHVGFGGDYLRPDWNDVGRVHDWRNYVSEEVRLMWHTFTAEQKRALARQADREAGSEEWD